MGQAAHLRNYASIDGCEVVAIAEPRPNLAAEVAAKFAVKNTYPDADSMMANEQIDALVAIQPFDRHGSIVKPLYRFGKPILTEKPLASSLEVATEMLDALKLGGSFHMVGYHKRSDPATEAAKAEIDRLKTTGELGRMRYIRITMPEGDWIASGFNELIHSDEAIPVTDADRRPSDMARETFSEYVSFVNYYIHQVNLLRHLFGELYRVTYAEASGVLMAVETVSGIAGTLEMTPYRTLTDWQESALVGFDHGYVKLNLPAPLALNRPGSLEIMRDRPGQVSQIIHPQLPWVHAMRRQAENFIASVQGVRPPPCEAAEALEDLRMAKQYVELRNRAKASG